MTQTLPYKRILLKFSGEALAEPHNFGIDPHRADFIASRVKRIYDIGIQVAIVIGGGNIWRGKQGVEHGMDPSTADHIGMLATVMNALALQDALERQGVITRVQTAIEMKAIAEPYIRLRAIRHMEKGRVVIIGGGMGQPFFTTDTAAAQRAAELNADILIKATQVNGVYSADPHKDPTAKRYEQVSYQYVLENHLAVMDMTAFTICQEKRLPILILDFWAEEDLFRAVQGDTSVGTLITV